MKKKKILAYILIAVMMLKDYVIMNGYSSFAKENDDSIATATDVVEELSEDNDIAANEDLEQNLLVESSDPFSDIFASEYSDELAEQIEVEDYKVYSVDIEDGKVARVSYDTLDDAYVIVSMVDEKNESSQVTFTKEISALANETVIELDKEIPTYYIVRAYIVTKEDLRPLSKEFESIMYTEQMQELSNMSTADFSEERVLNFDDDETNNFAIYDDDVVVIDNESEKNRVTFIDDESKKYVIENIDDSIRELKHGDIFSYDYNPDSEAYLIVKVSRIEIEGTTATIYGDEATLEEVFEYVKIDEEGDTSDVEVGDEELEGITYDGIVEENVINADAGGTSGEISNSVALKYTFREDKIESGNLKLSGSLNLSAKFKLKLYISQKVSYLQIGVDLEVSVDVAAKATVPIDIPLKSLKFDAKCAKLKVNLSVLIEIEIEGKIKAGFSTKLGGRITTNGEYRDESVKPNGFVEGAIQGTVFFGVKAELDAEASVLGKTLMSADIEGRAGLELQEKNIHNGTSDKKYEKHTCKSCAEGTVSGKLSLSIKTDVLDIKALTLSLKKSYSVELYKYYYSKDHNEFKQGSCPYKSYLIDVRAYKEATKEPMNRVTIGIIDSNNKLLFAEDTSYSGVVSTYLPAGKYRVTAKYKDKYTYQTIEITGGMTQLDFAYYLSNGEWVAKTSLEKYGDYKSFIKEDKIDINEANFPDENFRNFLITEIDTDCDKKIKIKDMKTLNCANRNISSLKGVELFTMLETLNCKNNSLTSLDVSKLEMLEEIDCSNNYIKYLNAINCPNLKNLTCNNNRIASLSLDGDISLEGLYCSNNALVMLDVSNLVNLKYLDCSTNDLCNLKVDCLPYLESLYCRENLLTSLDLLLDYNLRDLDCSDNRIQNIDLQGCIGLEFLYCAKNSLSSLELEDCESLMDLTCKQNKLQDIDVSMCSELKNLNCAGNELTELDVSGLENLSGVICADNNITEANASGCKNLHNLIIMNNPLETLCIDRCSSIHHIVDVDDDTNEITGSDVMLGNTMHVLSVSAKNCNDMRDIFLDSCTIDELVVTNCNKLETVDISGHAKVHSLDVSECSNMNQMYCKGAGLTSLIVDNCGVQSLDCPSNNLEEIDVSTCTNLSHLHCEANKLTELDVSGLKNLGDIVCNDNQLNSINAKGCTRLYGLAAMNNPLKVLCLDDCSSIVNIQDAETIDEHMAPTEITLDAKMQLSSLSAKNCLALKNVALKGCSVDALSLSNCANIQFVYVSDGAKVQALDVSDCVSMEDVYCKGAGLTSLVVKNCGVRRLDCPNNNLESIDVSTCVNLDHLHCDGNKLTELNLSGLEKLGDVICDDNQLAKFDARNCPRLRGITLLNNPLKVLNLIGCSSITKISDELSRPQYEIPQSVLLANDMVLSEINIQNCEVLESIELDAGVMESFSLEDCPNIKSVNLKGAKVNNLSVSRCTMDDIVCKYCKLETLVLNDCNVRSIDCSNNFLTALDISTCGGLASLDCSNNYLTSVDTSKNSTLKSFQFEPQKDPNMRETLDLYSIGRGAKICFDTEVEPIEFDYCGQQAEEMLMEAATTEISSGLEYNDFEQEISVEEIASDSEQEDDSNTPDEELGDDSEESGDEQPVSNKLFPDTVYNIYVLSLYDDETDRDILLNENLLYVRQCVTDANGELPTDLIPTYELEDYVVIARCEKQNLATLSGVKVDMDNLEYSGEEQYASPVITRNGDTLLAGVDYVIKGDYKATEKGTYTITIVGIGMYTGELDVPYAIVGDPDEQECEHEFVEYISDRNATCFEDGTKTAICEKGCGAKDVIVDVGSKLKFGWNDIDGARYYYDQEGNRVTNWQDIDSKWYYFDASGVMQTGWLKRGVKWYYFDASGVMQTGWLKYSDQWYYFDKNGAMQKGWVQISNEWYYFSNDGIMANGWKQIGTKWYYFNNGAMTTGWKQISNRWYYFDKTDGYMTTGWRQLSGKWYYFDKTDGYMITGWKQLSGKWYYFDKTDGYMITGWKQLSGKWYYFDTADGYMVTGWKQIGDKKYYFDPSTGAWVK